MLLQAVNAVEPHLHNQVSTVVSNYKGNMYNTSQTLRNTKDIRGKTVSDPRFISEVKWLWTTG